MSGGIDELKPCPFCGATPEIDTHRDYASKSDLWDIACVNDSCPMDSVWVDHFKSREEAIKAWNTRHDGQVPGIE